MRGGCDIKLFLPIPFQGLSHTHFVPDRPVLKLQIGNNKIGSEYRRCWLPEGGRGGERGRRDGTGTGVMVMVTVMGGGSAVAGEMRCVYARVMGGLKWSETIQGIGSAKTK